MKVQALLVCLVFWGKDKALVRTYDSYPKVLALLVAVWLKVLMTK